MAKQVIAADEVRRKAQAATLSDAPLQALANSNTPVPLPENAQEVKFDGDEGRLEFNSASSVKALSGFYRAALKPAGWKEQPSVINQPNMAVLEFAKGGKSITMTVMQMGPKVNVSADGSGLVMAAAKPASSGKPVSSDQTGASAKPGRTAGAGCRVRPAGAEAAQLDLARHRETARHRHAVPQGARRQRAGRAR